VGLDKLDRPEQAFTYGAPGLKFGSGSPSAVGYGSDDVDGLVEGSLQQERLLATAPLEVTGDDLAGIFTWSMDLW
jgi:hypothetical protein